MKRAKPAESAVAAVVVSHLDTLGAAVYQEVGCAGGVADIVARVGAELWIVEVKTSMSLALLIQAMERRRAAHRVIVAAPYSRHEHDVMTICAELGLGLWSVHVGQEGVDGGAGPGASSIRERVRSRRWNSRPVALAAELRPEHQTHAKAGSVGAGGRWTAYRDTCAQLARLVADQPGVTLKAAIEGVTHHYASKASARSALAKWIPDGRVPGVELRSSPAGIAQLFPTVTL